MAAQTEALLQKMQDQIATLQIDLAASAAATLAAKKTAAAVNTALAGLPPTGMPNYLCSFAGHGITWDEPTSLQMCER
jgi:hypothetical protein